MCSGEEPQKKKSKRCGMGATSEGDEISKYPVRDGSEKTSWMSQLQAVASWEAKTSFPSAVAF